MFYLSDQNAQHNTKLVQGPKGPTKWSGRDFPDVHWSETSKETTEQPDNKPASNDHLKGGAKGAQSHETSTD